MVADFTMRVHNEKIRHFDLLTAFGYMERDVIPIFSQKTYLTTYVRNIFLYKYHEIKEKKNFNVVNEAVRLRVKYKQIYRGASLLNKDEYV